MMRNCTNETKQILNTAKAEGHNSNKITKEKKENEKRRKSRVFA